MNVNQFKSHFYSGSEFVHLNNSGQSLIPDVYSELAKSWIDLFYSEGAFCSMKGWAQTEVTRKKLAQFLGADPSEVSFFTTTASALSQAALGLPLQAGDEILTWDQEYPSNFYPWRVAAEKNQAKLIQVESENYQTPAQKILDRITSRTKVIAVSWVQYQTGSVTDLKYLSEQLKGSGIWLVADIIQGAGVRPFNFHETGFDIVCGGSHKFLCSGYGAGYMIIKKEKMPFLPPIEVGAMTYGDPDTKKSFSIQPKVFSNRYEPGSKSMIEIIAMGATLDLFSEFGIRNIFLESSRLCLKLSRGLQGLGFSVIHDEGPILSFHTKNPDDLKEVMNKLSRGQVSFVCRGPGVRLSTHGYTRDDDIEKVLKLLS